MLTLAGELLGSAEGLLRDGLVTSEIADGYQKACDKVCVCGGVGGWVWVRERDRLRGRGGGAVEGPGRRHCFRLRQEQAAQPLVVRHHL